MAATNWWVRCFILLLVSCNSALGCFLGTEYSSVENSICALLIFDGLVRAWALVGVSDFCV